MGTLRQNMDSRTAQIQWRPKRKTLESFLGLYWQRAQMGPQKRSRSYETGQYIFLKYFESGFMSHSEFRNFNWIKRESSQFKHIMVNFPALTDLFIQTVACYFLLKHTFDLTGLKTTFIKKSCTLKGSSNFTSLTHHVAPDVYSSKSVFCPYSMHPVLRINFCFQVEVSKVSLICKLFESLFLAEKGGADFSLDENRFGSILNTTFAYAYFWGLSGNLNENSQDGFDTFAKDLFSDNGEAKVCLIYITVISLKPLTWIIRFYCMWLLAFFHFSWKKGVLRDIFFILWLLRDFMPFKTPFIFYIPAGVLTA